MARAIHWQIPFVSLNDTKFIINIYDEDYEGSVVTLTGASSPIITDESDDVDPFVAIRSQSGYIRVINNGDIDGLIPETNTSRYVTLTESSGVVRWQGFLCAESFSQDWDAIPYEVEIPIQSPLALLESKEMDCTLGLNSITLEDLIRETFVQMGFSDLYDTLYIDEIGDILTYLKWQVSRFNWFSKNNAEDDDSGDWKEYTGKTYKELLTDILEFFGMCIVERGTKLYIKSWVSFYDMYDRSNQYINSIAFADFLNGDDTAWNADYYKPLDFSTLVVAGSDHKQSITPGYRKVTVESKINAIGDLTEDIGIDGYDVINTNMQYMAEDKSITEDKDEAFYFYRTRLRSNKKGGCNLTLHTYSLGSLETEIPYPDIYNVFGSRLIYGCALVDFDSYTKDDIDNGKKNYDYSSGIICRLDLESGSEQYWGQYKTEPVYGWGEHIGFSLHGSERASFINGYLCLSAQLVAMDQPPLHRRNGLGTLTLGLRVGDMYWNGEEWTSTPSTFLVHCGAEGAENWSDEGTGGIIDTKTLDMDCNGASGYIIPITQQLSGDVELQFIDNFTSILTSSSSLNYAARYLIIESIGVKYYSPDTESLSTKDSNTYAKVTGKDFPDAESTTLNIASWNNNKKGYGILTYNEDYVQTAAFKIDGSISTLRPEQFLVNIKSEIYSHYLKSIIITAKHDDAINPLYRLKDTLSFDYFVVSESNNWRDGTTDYQLVELNY